MITVHLLTMKLPQDFFLPINARDPHVFTSISNIEQYNIITVTFCQTQQ